MIKKIVIVLLVMVTGNSFSQDLNLTQFYAAPLNLNPAYTGSHVCGRVGTNYRNQWRGNNDGYTTNNFYFDHYIPKYHSGVGMQYYKDVAGVADTRTDNVGLYFANEVQLHRYFAIRMGVAGNYINKSIYTKNLLFGDQIVRGNAPTSLESQSLSGRIGYFDASAGLLAYTYKSWFGISAFHLTKPTENIYSQLAVLDRKYSIHGGTHLSFISHDGKIHKDDHNFYFVFNYQSQSKFDQLDLGLYYGRKVIQAGLWYRGIPLIKKYSPGYSNNDAIALIIGYNTTRFHVGYSYDITISKLGSNSGGAHEVSMYYQLCSGKGPDKNHRKRMVVACPKF